MEQIKSELATYIQDPYNSQSAFKLATLYYNHKQYASAFSYFQRCADYSNDMVEIAECLLTCSRIMSLQGGRDSKEYDLIVHALSIQAVCPEVFYIKSRYHSWRNEWTECYTTCCLALKYLDNFTPTFKNKQFFEYHGKNCLLRQKANSAHKRGKINEARQIYIEIGDDIKKLPEPFEEPNTNGSNYSQSFQDLFVLKMCNYKKQGYYLEIGAGDYAHGNNTYLLEKDYDWEGISIDFNKSLVNKFNNYRKNICLQLDATKVNYEELLDGKKVIDYLQLDCDPANITFEILEKIPFSTHKFKVITYEHDFYNDPTQSFRAKSRELLLHHGYKLFAGNITPDRLEECPFEDWWIHPEFINTQCNLNNDVPIFGEKILNFNFISCETDNLKMEYRKHNNLVWWDDNNIFNFGDQINPWLFSKITGICHKDINKIPLQSTESIPRYYMIGSILNTIESSNVEVWGSGFAFNKQPKILPTKIHAVRGPISRKKFILLGCDCPEVYGDPALLLPKYYTSNVKKEYKYGIVQHFSHKKETAWVSKYINDPNINIIDVQNPSITGFIDEINKCEVILSSALHGIICGDAYGIPSYAINFSANNSYNWLKFNDYYLSVGRPLVQPILLLDENIDIYNLWPPLYNYSIKIDLDKLLEVCPFIHQTTGPKLQSQPIKPSAIDFPICDTPSSIMVFENFYKNPDEIRKYALGLNYQPPENHGAVGYRCQEGRKILPGTKEFFEKSLGCKIKFGTELGEWDYSTNGCFQWCNKDVPLVYHADSQEYAGIIYLTPDAPPNCGTSFFKHKKYNSMSGKDIFKHDDWHDPNLEYNDWFLDKEPWEQVDSIGNVYNRLVIFKASNVHAVTEYFGETIEDSRLFQLFFFNLHSCYS